MIAEEAFIGEVNCNGSETLLTGCDHIYEGVPIGCNNNNAAGAVCQQGQRPCHEQYLLCQSIQPIDPDLKSSGNAGDNYTWVFMMYCILFGGTIFCADWL